jgi:hypothetical protein
MKRRVINNKKLTGHSWANELGVFFVNLDGFSSHKSYNNDLIDKETFLLCAANCVITEPVEKTRRIVSDFKHKLYNK